MTIDLDQVVLDGGRQFVNFFEGRILTGRDMRNEQGAARQGRSCICGQDLIQAVERLKAARIKPR